MMHAICDKEVAPTFALQGPSLDQTYCEHITQTRLYMRQVHAEPDDEPPSGPIYEVCISRRNMLKK